MSILPELRRLVAVEVSERAQLCHEITLALENMRTLFYGGALAMHWAISPPVQPSQEDHFEAYYHQVYSQQPSSFNGEINEEFLASLIADEAASREFLEDQQQLQRRMLIPRTVLSVVEQTRRFVLLRNQLESKEYLERGIMEKLWYLRFSWLCTASICIGCDKVEHTYRLPVLSSEAIIRDLLFTERMEGLLRISNKEAQACALQQLVISHIVRMETFSRSAILQDEKKKRFKLFYEFLDWSDFFVRMDLFRQRVSGLLQLLPAFQDGIRGSIGPIQRTNWQELQRRELKEREFIGRKAIAREASQHFPVFVPPPVPSTGSLSMEGVEQNANLDPMSFVPIAQEWI